MANTKVKAEQLEAAQTSITSLGTLTSLTVDDITINGSTISDAADLTIDVGGDIILDAAGSDVRFHNAGTLHGRITNDSNGIWFISDISDKDIFIHGNDGGSMVTALTLDMSEAGAATFNGEVLIPEKLTHAGDTDTHFKFAGANDIRIVAGNVEHAAFDGTIVFNQSGADMDFRVESTNKTSMLHVDAGNDRVAIGTNAPTRTFTVYTTDQTDLAITAAANQYAQLAFGDPDDDNIGTIGYNNSDNSMQFTVNAAERMRIRSTGGVGIGTAGYDSQILAVNAGSGDTVLYGESTDANCFASFRDNSSTANISYGAIGNNHVFRSDSTEKMRIQSGGGISFNGDTAAANALDDYEEGTFTPSWGSAAGSGSTGYGSYVKVGKMVTVQMRWTAITHSGHSGANYIRDLPFDIYQTNAVQALGMDWMGYYVGFDASKRPGFLTAGADLMYGYYSNNAGGWTQWDVNNTSSKYLMLNITYRTT